MVKKTEKQDFFAVIDHAENKVPSFSKNESTVGIESFVASIWEEVTQNNISKALEDLESLRFVPIEVRRKLAVAPLFLVRYE